MERIGHLLNKSNLFIAQLEKLHLSISECKAEQATLRRENKILQLEKLRLQKENQYLRDHVPVEEARQCDTTAILSPGDRVEILKPTIPSNLEQRHIIETDCVGKVDYIQGQWVFVTTDSGFQRYRLPSGLKVISPGGINS